MIVEKGVSEGERIIVDGINKVYHGSLAEPITMAEHEASLAKEREQALEDQPPERPPEAPDEGH
jgi:hypothetical protein